MKTTWISLDLFRWVFILPTKYFQLLLYIEAFRLVVYEISCNIYSAMSVVCYRKRNIFLPLALQPNSGLGRLHETFRFTSVTRSGTVDRTTWMGNQLVAKPLPVQNLRKSTYNTNHKHPCCEWFEPTVPAFARAKRVHVLDRSATVTSNVI
jgi:hypothetical protein